MGRTALYRDPVPFRTTRADVQLDGELLILAMPDGRYRRVALDGVVPTTVDGCVRADDRRFVRMLVLEHRSLARDVLITPPEHGAVAPNVVSLPEAPPDAAVLDPGGWEALADWVLGGGRLAAYTIVELARLSTIATAAFAVLIGEVAAQRALELAWVGRGPLRGGSDLDSALQPFVDAARRSPRAAEALVSALAHAAGATRRRRR